MGCTTTSLPADRSFSTNRQRIPGRGNRPTPPCSHHRPCATAAAFRRGNEGEYFLGEVPVFLLNLLRNGNQSSRVVAIASQDLADRVELPRLQGRRTAVGNWLLHRVVIFQPVKVEWPAHRRHGPITRTNDRFEKNQQACPDKNHDRTNRSLRRLASTAKLTDKLHAFLNELK